MRDSHTPQTCLGVSDITKHHIPLAIAGALLIDAAWTRAKCETAFAAVGEVYSVGSADTALDVLSESTGKFEGGQLWVDARDRFFGLKG